MIAARHFWNTGVPLVGQPIERQLLKEPLKIILECVAATADKQVKEVLFYNQFLCVCFYSVIVRFGGKIFKDMSLIFCLHLFFFVFFFHKVSTVQ